MNMQALMQQAQKMQREMQKKQAELEAKTFHIESAGGAVTIDIKGSRQIEAIRIDPDAMDDKEMLEEMILLAVNEAIKTVDAAFEELNAAMAGGMKIPGF